MSTTPPERKGPARNDLIWRLDDENPSHEIEREMLQEQGYTNLVVTRSSAYREDYGKYAPQAKGILLQVSFSPLSAEDIRGLASCKIISVTGGGFNHVDIDAATRHGIIVTYVPGYCLEEVSDHTLALILALSRHLPECQNMTRKALWKASDIGPLTRIKGQVLGILGLGRIGRAVARKARCFGLSVKGYDPYVSESDLSGQGIECVRFDDLVRTSDFISLHVLLTKETYHLFNAEVFESMKDTAYLINTCRGEVIDELALVDALKKREIAGAGLDVLAQEPPDRTNPLLSMPNVIVTPHSAFVSQEARMECKSRAIKAVADALEGKIPEDMINPEALNHR